MILEYRGKSFLSRTIRLFAWLRFWTQASSRYSHTAWTFATISDGRLCGDTSEWEAWQKGGVQHVESIGFNHVPGTRIDLFELRQPLNRKEKEMAMLFLSKHEGEGYDFWTILGFVVRRNLDDAGKWVCAELILGMLRAAGRVMLNFVELWQCAPGTLPTSPDSVYVGYILAGDPSFRVYQDSEKMSGLSGILRIA